MPAAFRPEAQGWRLPWVRQREMLNPIGVAAWGTACNPPGKRPVPVLSSGRGDGNKRRARSPVQPGYTARGIGCDGRVSERGTADQAHHGAKADKWADRQVGPHQGWGVAATPVWLVSARCRVPGSVRAAIRRAGFETSRIQRANLPPPASGSAAEHLHCRLGAVLHLELLVDAFEMTADGGVANAQLVGNFLVEQTPR